MASVEPVIKEHWRTWNADCSAAAALEWNGTYFPMSWSEFVAYLKLVMDNNYCTSSLHYWQNHILGHFRGITYIFTHWITATKHPEGQNFISYNTIYKYSLGGRFLKSIIDYSLINISYSGLYTPNVIGHCSQSSKKGLVTYTN